MFAHTRILRVLPWALIALLGSCTPAEEPCARFFEPYPDLNPTRARTVRNGALVDAMALYEQRDLAKAAETLEAYVAKDPEEEATARFYLANCYLGIGRPYDAERELDFVERGDLRPFQDETEWYNTLC